MWGDRDTDTVRRQLGIFHCSDEQPSETFDIGYGLATKGKGEERFGSKYWKQRNVVPTHYGDAGMCLGKQMVTPLYDAQIIAEMEQVLGRQFRNCPMLLKCCKILQPSMRIVGGDENGCIAPIAMERVLCSLGYCVPVLRMCDKYSYTSAGKMAVRNILENLVSLHEEGYYFPCLSIHTIFVAASTQVTVMNMQDFALMDLQKNLKLEGVDMSKPHHLSYYFAFGVLVDSTDKQDPFGQRKQSDWQRLWMVLSDLRKLHQIEGDNEMVNLEDAVLYYYNNDHNPPGSIFYHPSLWTDVQRISFVMRSYSLLKCSGLTYLTELRAKVTDYEVLREQLAFCLPYEYEKIERHNIPILDLLELVRNVFAHFRKLNKFCTSRKICNSVDDLLYAKEPLLFVRLAEYMGEKHSLYV